jgi:hypothetical protein
VTAPPIPIANVCGIFLSEEPQNFHRSCSVTLVTLAHGYNCSMREGFNMH